jgi:hypothetical protein
VADAAIGKSTIQPGQFLEWILRPTEARRPRDGRQPLEGEILMRPFAAGVSFDAFLALIALILAILAIAGLYSPMVLIEIAVILLALAILI